jgi:hypothetical protein
MRNELSALPWRPGQFHRVEYYWEAVGVLAAIKAGIGSQAARVHEGRAIRCSRRITRRISRELGGALDVLSQAATSKRIR